MRSVGKRKQHFNQAATSVNDYWLS